MYCWNRNAHFLLLELQTKQEKHILGMAVWTKLYPGKIYRHNCEKWKKWINMIISLQLRLSLAMLQIPISWTQGIHEVLMICSKVQMFWRLKRECLKDLRTQEWMCSQLRFVIPLFSLAVLLDRMADGRPCTIWRHFDFKLMKFPPWSAILLPGA